MRTSACASVGIVTKLMNVHAALSRGVVASDVVFYGGWRRLRRLLEGHGTANIGVTAEDCDCCNKMDQRHIH